ncbi:hypothetical protein M413DRAFT_297297 [Hebeloma cylindrosporum]|uniref:DNA replication checkpoint mediator MRC1 domain-containing protein n=1 Tax=Hebeloma cylindrosporum TaxID=76867 RepID=A0A0C3CAR7_HEBCY|nr:hypothetical protein M413DRAFT_297297 [Hebeloma cylindrosporum h7]
MSSSPQLTPDASSAKRPLRTYRRREEPPAEDAGTSVTSLGSIYANADSVHCTAPPGLSEEIPPSSPRTSHAVRGHTNDDEAPESPKFDYKWRTELKRLDEDEDDLPEDNDPPTASVFGQPHILHVAAGISTDSSSRTKSHVSKPSPPASDDVFCGSNLDKNASPSQISSAKPSFVLSSPAVGRARNSRVIQDSDSEPEPLKDSSSTTPSSSSQLQHLISPKSRSLSTPPTSEDDMPGNILTKPRSSGRRKPLAASRGSVPPLEFNEGPSSEVRRPSGTKQRSRKFKAPTKKDMAEIAKERGRLAAQTAVSIARNEKSSKYTVENLFAKIHDGHPKQPPPSDPIEPFSSSPPTGRSTTTQRPSHILELPDDPDEDDLELPPVSAMLGDIMEKTRRKDLQDMKQKLIHSKKPPVDLSYDDDDLEIIPRSPNKMALMEQRKKLKERRISEGRKRQMRLANIGIPNAAVPIVGHSQGGIASIISQQATTRVDQVALNRIMAAEVRKEAQQATKQKEEVWQKHGGHLRTRPNVQPEGLSIAVESLAKKVLKAAELDATNKMDIEGDDEDERSDEDWSPDFKGSGSPEPAEQEASDEQEEGDENAPMDEDTIMVAEASLDDDEDGNIRTSTSRRTIVQSDSEDEGDENAPAKPQRYRRSTSSSERYTEDEQDKENDTTLMYDGTEDKENETLARRQCNSSRSIFDATDIRNPSLSPTFPSQERNARNGDIQSQVGEQRSPLKELISEESPSSLRSSTLTQSFAAKLQQASPLHDTMGPTSTLQPFLFRKGGSAGFDGFSQFSQCEPDVYRAAPSLQPGFSELFENATEKQRESSIKADRGGSRSGSGEANVSEPRIPHRTDTLELTQDVTSALSLQPAFQVQESLMRKADAIFEKEQAFVLEAAKKKHEKASSALYVNEHGFLTQTRPENGSPEIYRPSPSQSLYSGDSFRAPLISPLQARPRAPLRTLSISSPFRQPESPEQAPLRRLRKAPTPPPLGSRTISPQATTPPRKLNAFEALARGATKAEKRRPDKAKSAELSVFVENEAAESDDEDVFGFAKPKDDDEEEGEDLDKPLDVLMDDKEMDEATVAAELVHEKFMEQAEEADKKLQQMHMEVVQGEHRKRQRGVGVDDSDEESEDGDNSKALRAMKKSKIERGDIKDLGANEETRAFADTYQQTLQDDDQEFSYLVDQSESNVLGGRVMTEEEWEEVQNKDIEQEEETFTLGEFTHELRQRKAAGVEDVAMDPEDVSWVEDDQKEEITQLKTVNSRQRPRGRLQDSDTSELDGTMGAFRRSGDQINVSSKQWLAQENRSRNAGTSRSVGGSAITGHAKAKSKTGAISSRKGTSAQDPPSSTTGNKGVKSAPSMLSVITDKSRHFA